jgi:hypothetical protein
MNKDAIIQRIHAIVDQFDARVDVKVLEDKSFIEFIITRDGWDLDVTAPLIDGSYYLYDVESTGLPRELYANEPRDVALRDEEIEEHLVSILGRTMQFHPAPLLFYTWRGYLVLNIDGKPRKVMQRRNYFQLPPHGD